MSTDQFTAQLAAYPKHEHPIDRGLVIAGRMVTPCRCKTCGLRLHELLARESGSCVVRPGWEGPLRFTVWNPYLPIQGRA